MITVLSGGVGAAKLLRGFERQGVGASIAAVVNTGDDEIFYGLKVCPDLDSVTYALAGLSNEVQGWGVTSESYQALEMLKTLGDDAWFALGDRDLGTHLYRSRRLSEGASLTEITDEIRIAHGISSTILPMTDDSVRTTLEVEIEVETPNDAPHIERTILSFQEYFVKHHHGPKVHSVRFDGSETSAPTRQTIDALSTCDRIIIAPSNPVLSIQPILAFKEITEILRHRRDDVIAVSPIIGGKAIKGPADRLLEGIWGRSSSVTVAELYRELASRLVVDEIDSGLVDEIDALGVTPIVTSTLMHTGEDEIRLAGFLAGL